MKIFSYVVKEFFKYVGLTLSLCVFLFVLFDFIHKTTKYFSKHNPATSEIVLYYIYQIPFQLIQALPIAALLASVVTMVLLSRTNEITAMRSAGLSPLKIGLPLAFGGGICGLFIFFMSEVILPVSSARLHQLEEVEIKGGSPSKTFDGSSWFRQGNSFFYLGEFDAKIPAIKDLRVYDVDEAMRIVGATVSPTAILDKANKEWSLRDATRLSYESGQVMERQSFASLNMQLPVEQSQLTSDWRLVEEFSFLELRRSIKLGERFGSDVLKEKVAFHLKFAFPFSALLVSLVGLQFGFKSERKNETVRSILAAFGVGISYWFFMSAGKALSIRGDISPILGAWLANAVLAMLVTISYLRVTKLR